MKEYKVTLTTVASVTVTVTAPNEDRAIEIAYDRAEEVAGLALFIGDGQHLDLNGSWQLQEPYVEETGKSPGDIAYELSDPN
jgi:hypothetical protein